MIKSLPISFKQGISVVRVQTQNEQIRGMTRRTPRDGISKAMSLVSSSSWHLLFMMR